VELLTSAGASFSPAVTTTTDVNGFYTFTNVTLGTTYMVRGSFRGDSATVTAKFSANPTKAPDIKLLLSKLYGRVVNSDGSAAVGAKVVLIQNGVELRSTITDTSGNYSFGGTSAGQYSVRATLGAASGQRNKLFMQRGLPYQAPDVILQVGSAGNPTVFSATTRAYIVSFPYETNNSPTTNNKNITGLAPSTIAVKDAFDVLPVDSTGVRNYTLERLNPLTGLYERLDSGTDLIERGRGYRLKVQRGTVSLKLGATPLENTQAFFQVSLRRNASSTSANNGLNIIGFGFNPKTFSKVSWETARVKDDETGIVYESPAAAAQAGVMDAGIFTLDPTGSSETTIYTKNLTPYAGYYARTYHNVTIVLRNAQ
jgi:hypothetical protein